MCLSWLLTRVGLVAGVSLARMGSVVHLTPESSLGYPGSRTGALGLVQQHPYIHGADLSMKLETFVPSALECPLRCVPQGLFRGSLVPGNPSGHKCHCLSHVQPRGKEGRKKWMLLSTGQGLALC